MSRKIHAKIVHDSDRGDRHTERHYVCLPPAPGKGWESTAERQKTEKDKERSAPRQPEVAKRQ